ncbi:MAG: cation transporter [Rhodothermales bacterium]|nr:cation transporter [Rhodothermales bacterium]
MRRSTYQIEKMDCTAEEQLVRMRLDGVEGILRLDFDLPARRLQVHHTGDERDLRAALVELGLGARGVESVEVTAGAGDSAASAGDADAPGVGGLNDAASDTSERKPLMAALAINATFFVAEFAAGLLAGSMGLVADSLDMLADAFVYALSLAAVGGTVLLKKRLARGSGYLQLGLAVIGLVEVARRFVFVEDAPDVATMVIVAALALAGNAVTLWLLSKAKRGEAHVEASWIFTSNDIKVNALVIVSALLVWATASAMPDLIAGGLIFVIVARGARQILALAR